MPGRRLQTGLPPEAQDNLDHVTVEEGSLGWECVLNIQQEPLDATPDFVLAHA